MVVTNAKTPASLEPWYDTGQVVKHECKAGTYFKDGTTNREYMCIREDQWRDLPSEDPGCEGTIHTCENYGSCWSQSLLKTHPCRALHSDNRQRSDCDSTNSEWWLRARDRSREVVRFNSVLQVHPEVQLQWLIRRAGALSTRLDYVTSSDCS